jgi:mxaJ protein
MRTTAFAALALSAMATSAGAAVTQEPAGDSRVLRVCADPNNLPFSNDRGEGIDNALARLVAGALGAKVEYTWLPQRRGFVRNTLDAGTCDVMMEAPVGYERALTTAPYYRSTYVFLARRARRDRPAIRSLDDPRLAHLRIGIQVIGDDYANPPPAEALGRRGLARNVVGFPVYGDYAKPAPLSPIADAVAGGSIDVAIVWGPLGGWYAKQSRVPLSVTPIAMPGDDQTDLPLTFSIGMAVRHGNVALRRRLETVIRDRAVEIAAILKRFGVPAAGRTQAAARPAHRRRQSASVRPDAPPQCRVSRARATARSAMNWRISRSRMS